MTEKLADRLRELLTLRSMHAKEVSLKAGLGETYIGDIFSGKNKNPRASGLQSIADVLQVSLQYLLGESDILSTTDGERRSFTMVNATTWRISIDVIVSTKTAYAILDVLRQEDEERLKEKR